MWQPRVELQFCFIGDGIEAQRLLPRMASAAAHYRGSYAAFTRRQFISALAPHSAANGPQAAAQQQ